MKKKTLTQTEIEILNKTLRMIIEFGEPKIINSINRSIRVSLNNNKTFTYKEIRIIRLRCDEYTNIEIGVKLGLTMKSIEKSRALIFKKTRSKNSAGVVKYAIKHKLYILK